MSRRERLFARFDAIVDSLIVGLWTKRYFVAGPLAIYQDSPWLGLEGARRAVGTRERLQAMIQHLDEQGIDAKTVLDIGCNVGFFSLSFVEKGAMSFGVDMDSLMLRIACIGRKRMGNVPGEFAPIRMVCTPESVALLPRASVTVCLSIWHHWVRYQGLEAATEILKTLWRKTEGVLFFDSGEQEMGASYNLPFGDTTPALWLEKYLASSLDDAYVSNLGQFSAFGPRDTDEKVAGVMRSLFAVTRKAT